MAEPNTITVHRDLAFHETPERTLSLDVYEPTASGPRPTVLLLHGGGFLDGDKGELSRYALAFADRGYVAVESQYRLADEASFPAALIDVKAAIEWLRSEGDAYGVDPRRIAVLGYSAGATLATLAAATADDPAFEPETYPGASSAVGAAVGYAGVYDLATLDAPEIHREYVGGDPADDPDLFDLVSPLCHVDVALPPTLLLHGLDDEVVPPEQSRRYREALEDVAEVELELLSGDGADHLFPLRAETHEETVDRTVAFLERQL